MDPSVTDCERAPERSLFQSFPSPSFSPSLVPRRRRSGFWRVGEGRIEIGIGGGGDDTSLRRRSPFSRSSRRTRKRRSEGAGAASVGDTTCQRVTVCVLIHHSATEGKKECASRRGTDADGRREREISAEICQPPSYLGPPARFPPLRNWGTDSGKRN